MNGFVFAYLTLLKLVLGRTVEVAGARHARIPPAGRACVAIKALAGDC